MALSTTYLFFFSPLQTSSFSLCSHLICLRKTTNEIYRLRQSITFRILRHQLLPEGSRRKRDGGNRIGNVTDARGSGLSEFEFYTQNVTADPAQRFQQDDLNNLTAKCEAGRLETWRDKLHQ